MSAEASSSRDSTTKPPAPAPPASGAGTDDIEKLLSREATAFQREMEVERILKAFKLKCAFPATFPSTSANDLYPHPVSIARTRSSTCHKKRRQMTSRRSIASSHFVSLPLPAQPSSCSREYAY